ncbi:hypothetical protein GDO81_004588 [Engystomops pustulosus]|uniref:Uncharacterized protein n=1 Tax=Engystomops pustulosus TaxID=76066 RepID=A0AAV6ZTJ8_ENGPU|nr:hypothetical protein GDO81_004588 [Engystomops pustulosus]
MPFKCSTSLIRSEAKNLNRLAGNLAKVLCRISPRFCRLTAVFRIGLFSRFSVPSIRSLLQCDGIAMPGAFLFRLLVPPNLANKYFKNSEFFFFLLPVLS